MLETRGLTKSFGGLSAVDRIDFGVRHGERRGIIGPNGAGKTTLFRLLSGESRATSGRVLLFGSDITRMAVHRRARMGLGRTYQITNIFLTLSVSENLELAAIRSERLALMPWWRRKGQVEERVASALQMADLSHIAGTRADEVSHGEQRQIELAIALMAKPSVLLLDEPAAGLSATEREHMAKIITQLPDDLTLCLIEHDMEFALGMSDNVTCLDHGKVIATGTPDEIRNDRQVQAVYLGDEEWA